MLDVAFTGPRELRSVSGALRPRSPERGDLVFAVAG